MKYIFASVIILISCYGFAQTEELLEIRNIYYQASKSSKIANDLQKRLENVSVESDPVIYGYKGMSELMVCYHSINPYKKLRNFAKGKDFLEKAIAAAPGNAELSYLRFSVQTNAPGFLNYNNNIKDDKIILLSYLRNKTEDVDLYDRIKKYMLESSHCSESEKTAIKDQK